jgi:hypothetical protein
LRKLFKILINHNIPETERQWYHVFGWWEIRRIVYNITLLFFGIISIFCMTFVVEGAGDFIQGLAIIGFAFFANFFYTFGWIVEIFYRLINRHKATLFGLKSFKIGFIIAILGTFAPPLFFGISGLIRGEKYSSPYSHFATIQPKLYNIAGDYKLDDITMKELKFPDSLIKKTIIRFNSDKTFEMKYFPHHVGMKLNNYNIINTRGEWEIEESQGHWVIGMRFDSITNCLSGYKYGGYYNTNGYNIYGNKPPYKIYIIVGDPDSWLGLILHKK